MLSISFRRTSLKLMKENNKNLSKNVLKCNREKQKVDLGAYAFFLLHLTRIRIHARYNVYIEYMYICHALFVE